MPQPHPKSGYLLRDGVQRRELFTRDQFDADLLPVLGHHTIEHTPRFLTFEHEQGSDERLAINLIGLNLTLLSRGGDRRGVDDISLQVLAYRDAMKPEAVQAGFWDDNEWPSTAPLGTVTHAPISDTGTNDAVWGDFNSGGKSLFRQA